MKLVPPAFGRGGGEGVRTRDHLANTRNLLAWCRLSAVLIAVGFSIDKVGQLEIMVGASSAGAHAIGLTTAATGLVVVVAAAYRFVRQRAAIETSVFAPSYRADLVIAVLAAAGGIAALVQLIVSR